LPISQTLLKTLFKSSGLCESKSGAYLDPGTGISKTPVVVDIDIGKFFILVMLFV